MPAAFWPSINNGVATYLIVGTLAVIVAIALPGLRRIVPGGLIAIAVLAIVTVSWGFFFDTFVTYAHVIASVVFFGLIAAVAVVNAIGRREDEFPPTRPFRISYITIAVLMVLDMGVLIPSAHLRRRRRLGRARRRVVRARAVPRVLAAADRAEVGRPRPDADRDLADLRDSARAGRGIRSRGLLAGVCGRA